MENYAWPDGCHNMWPCGVINEYILGYSIPHLFIFTSLQQVKDFVKFPETFNMPFLYHKQLFCPTLVHSVQGHYVQEAFCSFPGQLLHRVFM